MNKAIFIDKDGTLVVDVPYNVDPDRIRLTEGAIEGLQRLKSLGYLLIVISNQAGIAHGYFSESSLKKAEDTLRQMLKQGGLSLDAFFYCPHHPKGRIQRYSKICSCRKPKPGMIFEAAVAFNIDLSRSWMIGDILNDVEAGNRAGCRTLLIDNGNETEWVLSSEREPTGRVQNLSEAADFIQHQTQLA